MTHIETLKLALEYVESVPDDRYNAEHIDPEALVTALRQVIAEAKQAQPVAFEEWLAKQHGDPEEIGFLQALRIAYIAGQDSITSPPPRQPLTAMEVYDVVRDADLDWHTGFALGEDENRFVVFARAIEAAHGIKENT